MRIERATYGAVGEGHGLIASSMPAELLPQGLAGRTDRPPGIMEPGIRWSPSIGCAPMEGWWVFWRSVEDPRPRRGGMVRAQVALVPLDALDELHDIQPLLELLDVDDPQTTPTLLVTKPPTLQPPAGYHELVAHLIAGLSPVVVPDVFALPGLICALWPRLWPRARRKFAARVLFDPESSGTPSRWWIVATPSVYAKHWPREQLVTLQDGSFPRSMAMAWLLGEPQPAFDRMMALVELPDTFASLRSIERLVTLEPALASQNAGEDTLMFLRQAVQLSHGSSGPSGSVVGRAAEALARQLPGAGIEVVLGLANVAAESLDVVATAVTHWVETLLPVAADGDAVRLLQRLDQGRSALWWLESVSAGVTRGLASLEPAWVAALFRWWVKVSSFPALEDRLPAEPAIEATLLAMLPVDELEEIGETLRRVARVRGWSRLHGAVLASTHEAAAACAEQRSFTPDAAPGLHELCRRWSAQTIVDVAVAAPCPVLIEEAAAAIHSDRHLLLRLDPAVHGWRLIWLASIPRRADPWDGVSTPLAVFHALIGQMLDRAPLARELVEALLRSAHANILGHPARAQLWSRLPAQVRTTILENTADAWIQGLGAGSANTPLEILEQPLVAMIVERAEIVLGPRISGATLVRFLEGTNLSDPERAASLFRKLQRPLDAASARALGRSIRAQGWRRIAGDLASARGYLANDLDPLLEQCESLLGFFQPFRLFRLERSPERRDEALEAFFVECFDQGSLERWIAHFPDGRKILSGMPGPNAPLEAQVAEAIRIFSRLRLLDNEFFDRLDDEFKRHRTEISALRRMFCG